MLINILNCSWIDNNKLKQTKTSLSVSIDNIHLPADIYCQVEPEAILPREDWLINNYNKYKYIFTFNKKILDVCPNSRKYIFGTTWIFKEEYECVYNKEYLLTMITGNKLITPAHQFRQIIYNMQNDITNIPIQFFRSKYALNCLKDFGNNPSLKNDRKIHMLKYSQFHIVIENSSQKNYFTEKICDALITKNIPIYYGCPNINEFFDTTGWIILDSLDINIFFDKIAIINSEYYKNHIDIVNKNFNKVMEYISFEENLNKCLELLED